MVDRILTGVAIALFLFAIYARHRARVEYMEELRWIDNELEKHRDRVGDDW